MSETQATYRKGAIRPLPRELHRKAIEAFTLLYNSPDHIRVECFHENGGISVQIVTKGRKEHIKTGT